MIRIVAADDHPIVRSGIVALLESDEDFQIVGQAANGSEALALVATYVPDVLLTDLRMPGMEGQQLAAAVAAKYPAVKVLVLTSYETDRAILSAIEAGAVGYLLKAAPHDEIVTGIRAVVAGQTALSPSVAAALVRSARSAPTTLTARETEVLTTVAAGLSNAQIGAALHLSEATVKTHLIHIFGKLGVSDRTRAVTLAMERGLI